MTMVREAEERDIPRLHEILAQCPEAGRWSTDDLRQDVPRGTGGCLVAEQGDRVIGLLLVQCPTPDEAEILAVAVEPTARRRGAARALVEAFLRSRQGHVFLEVRRSNIAAQRLYEACGFVRTGIRQDYYSSPVEDALLFAWPPI